MPPEAPPVAHATLVADPRLEKELRKELRGRVPIAERADIIQSVLEALLRHQNPPDTLNGLVALGRRILRNDLTDYYRHRATVRAVVPCARDERHDESIAPPVPTDAWDPIDVDKRARFVEFLRAQGSLTDDDLKILETGHTEGYVALAQEFGVSQQALRVRAHRKRTLLRERWARYVASGIPGLAVVILLVYALAHRKDDRGHEITADTSAPYRPSRREQALSLRKAATKACAASLWDDCVDKLEKARELDPAGDTDPNIQDLRDEANQALHPPPVEPKRQDKPPMP
jgi:DNA-directed RNA polymerase specialized sigma24 family protein